MDWHGAQGCHSSTGKGTVLTPNLVPWQALSDACQECALTLNSVGSIPSKRVILHLFLPGTSIRIDVENVKAAGVICVLGISFGIGTYVLYKIYNNFIKPKFDGKRQPFSDDTECKDDTEEEEFCPLGTDEGKMGNDHSIADIPVYYKPGHGVSLYKPSEKIPIIPTAGAQLRNRKSAQAHISQVTNELLQETLKVEKINKNGESVQDLNGKNVPHLEEISVEVDESEFVRSDDEIEDVETAYSDAISSSLKGNFSPRSLYEKSSRFASSSSAVENDEEAVFFPTHAKDESVTSDANKNSQLDSLNLVNAYGSSSVLLTPPSEDEISSSEKHLLPGSSHLSYHTTKSDVSDIRSEVASLPSDNVVSDPVQGGSGVQTDDEADNLSPLPYDKPPPEKHFKKKLMLRLNEISFRKNRNTGSNCSSPRSSTPDSFLESHRPNSVDRPESLSGISSPELDLLHSESTDSPMVVDTFENLEDEIHEVEDEFEMISTKLQELTSRCANTDDNAGLAIVDEILTRYPSIRVRQKSLNSILGGRLSSLSQNESLPSSNYTSDTEPELSWDLENVLEMVYNDKNDVQGARKVSEETRQDTDTSVVTAINITASTFNSTVEMDGSLYEDDFHLQLGDNIEEHKVSINPSSEEQNSGEQGEVTAMITSPDQSPEGVASPDQSSASIVSAEQSSASNRDVEHTSHNSGAASSLKPKTICNIGAKQEISQYAGTEWKGETLTARVIKQGYEEIPKRCECCHLRRIRGDNYCGIRGVVYQALVNKLPPCHLMSSMDQVLELLTQTFSDPETGLLLWNFANRISFQEDTALQVIHRCVQTLYAKLEEVKQHNSYSEREDYVVNLLNSDPDCDLELMEGVKLLMLLSAIQLYRDVQQGNDVPVFAWLLFARDTSENLKDFVRNHLNPVGDSGGLEQVEMFLLGHTLGVRIQVFRLAQFGQDDFVSYYPDDCRQDWPTISLLAEDDRHYNVPVL